MLGLSQTTVSRALNGYPEVSEATRRRVRPRRRAAELPPRHARHERSPPAGRWLSATSCPLSTRNTRWSTRSSPTSSPARARSIPAAGYDMSLAVVGDERRGARPTATSPRSGTVDGLIAPRRRSLATRASRCCSEIGLPFVVHGRIDRRRRRLQLGRRQQPPRLRSARPVPCSTSATAGSALVNGLDRHGLRRCAAAIRLPPRARRPRPSRRRPLMRLGRDDRDLRLPRRARMMAEAHDPPTAFLAASMIIALGVRRAIEEMGLAHGPRRLDRDPRRRPRLSPQRGTTSPIFTALRVSVREMGRLSPQMLLDQIADPDAAPRQVLIEADLMAGPVDGPGARARPGARESPMSMNFTRRDFPDDFLFGAATSSYQIEGHAFGGAGLDPLGHLRRHPRQRGAGRERRARLRPLSPLGGGSRPPEAANFDVYRFSTSWARVMPEGRGTPNAEGLDFYDRLVDGLLARGIKPAATLYHWELPSALADLGGWRNATSRAGSATSPRSSWAASATASGPPRPSTSSGA